jgi:hypothetical protein
MPYAHDHQALSLAEPARVYAFSRGYGTLPTIWNLAKSL